MRMQELIDTFRGNNVAILTDDAYGAVLFVNYLTSAMCRNDEDFVFAIFHETTCSRLYKILTSLGSENLCVSELMKKVNVIKVGKNDNVGFGKLLAFIEDRGDIIDIAAEIGRIIRDKCPDSTIIFFGFNIGVYAYNAGKIVRALEELLSRVRNTMYFVISTTQPLDLIANVFDVVLCISKLESFSGMRPSNVYNVYVEHSIIHNLQQIPLYRIDEMCVIEL